MGQFSGFGVGRVTCWALAHVLRAVLLKCSQFAGRFELDWDWGGGCSSAAVMATRGSNSESRTCIGVWVRRKIENRRKYLGKSKCFAVFDGLCEMLIILYWMRMTGFQERIYV